MKQSFKLSIIIILTLLITVGCINKKEARKEENLMGEFNDKINIIINNSKYVLELENNTSSKELYALLPINEKFSELNGNEKYLFLNKKITSNPQKIDQIKKGDVYLYGDNCLVIFYKDFKTSYTYTKIGHIIDMEDLNYENIIIEIEK